MCLHCCSVDHRIHKRSGASSPLRLVTRFLLVCCADCGGAIAPFSRYAALVDPLSTLSSPYIRFSIKREHRIHSQHVCIETVNQAHKRQAQRIACMAELCDRALYSATDGDFDSVWHLVHRRDQPSMLRFIFYACKHQDYHISLDLVSAYHLHLIHLFLQLHSHSLYPSGTPRSRPFHWTRRPAPGWFTCWPVSPKNKVVVRPPRACATCAQCSA